MQNQAQNFLYDAGQLYGQAFLYPALVSFAAMRQEGGAPDTEGVQSCTQLFYIAAGAGQIAVAGKTHPAPAHTLAAIAPHTPYRFQAAPNTFAEYLLLGIGGVNLMGPAQQPCCIFTGEQARRQLYPHLAAIEQELRQHGPFFPVAASGHVQLLVAALLRQAEQREHAPLAKKADRLFYLATQYMAEHYTENITLESLAEAAQSGKYYLCHVFKKKVGISPINYLTRLRIQQSCRYLGDTAYSISHIAQLLSFSSTSYFSQCFHKQMGISPAAYRRQLPGG
ncbi:MAG: AraC family transcriptional regulator [Oscillospiraceae bacterium]